MRILLTAVLFVGAFAVGLYADRDMAPANEAARYVDIQRCLSELASFQDGAAEIQARYQTEGDRLQGVAAELRAREAELQQLDPESEAFALGELRLKADQEVATREVEFLRRRQGQELDELLDATVRAVHVAAAQLGEQQGFSAVLMKPGAFLDRTRATATDSLDELETRWVMWVHPDHDVTDQVLAILGEQG